MSHLSSFFTAQSHSLVPFDQNGDKWAVNEKQKLIINAKTPMQNVNTLTSAWVYFMYIHVHFVRLQRVFVPVQDDPRGAGWGTDGHHHGQRGGQRLPHGGYDRGWHGEVVSATVVLYAWQGWVGFILFSLYYLKVFVFFTWDHTERSLLQLFLLGKDV